MNEQIRLAKQPPQGVPVWDVDPYALDILHSPEAYYAELRAKGPFAWLSRYNILVCGRYAETKEVFSDWQRFVSSRGVGLTDFKTETPWRQPSILLEVDPPYHTRTRTVAARVLSPRAVGALKERFLAEADAMVDRLVGAGTFDAVREFGEVYPLKVFPDAVGIAADDRFKLLTYGAMVFNGVGPDNDIRRKSLANAPEVVPWIMSKCAREAITADGFAAGLYAAADAGDITQEEAGMLVRSLLSAGVDTTAIGLSNLVWCFAGNPGEYEKLKANPALMRPAFEEVLRYTSPVHGFYRTANVDTEVSGIRIAEGTKILCCLGAANLDDAQFPDAARFDITRKAAGHVAFGVGIHGCVGQNLARMEAEAVMTALLRKVGSIEKMGEAVWRPNNSLRGLDSFSVRLHPHS